MIREYTEEKSKLSYYVPFFSLIKRDNTLLMINKNGTIQKTLKFRGYDLNSSVKSEMIATTSSFNNILRKIGENYTFHVEAQRMKSKKYVSAEFKSKAAKLIDIEREQFFNAGNHYESNMYFTLTYLLPKDTIKKAEGIFFERGEEKTGEIDYIGEFLKVFDEIVETFKDVFLEVEVLDERETLTYLHSTVSAYKFEVKAPNVPAYIANYLCDSSLTGGLKPKLANKHLRCISLQGFPNFTEPAFLENLNNLDIEYRWVHRFICLSKVEALKLLEKKWKLWFSGRNSMLDILKEQITGTAATKVNMDAINKAEEVDGQIQLTTADVVSQGYSSCVVIVSDENETVADQKAAIIKETINKKGFTAIIETLNGVEAFLGSVPGNIYNNIRKPIINSFALSHLLPTSNIWAGDEYNKHFSTEDYKAPALIYTQTEGSTPFRLNLHVSEVGHTLITGRTGGGKSVLLGTIAAQFTKYPNNQIFFFDKDRSSMVLTKAIGGRFYNLGEEDLSFQPLRNINIISEREWANGWLLDIFETENVKITPILKEKIWNALCLMSELPENFRTLSTFKSYLNDQELQEAITPYTKAGAAGRYFDNSNDNLDFISWQVFEMNNVVNNKQVLVPLLDYLFHRIELNLSTKPTLLILDECWLFLDNPRFATKIKDWLKTLRKKNASVVFATQELNDVKKSSIFETILDACETRIFLANNQAKTSAYYDIYKTFNLNEREIEIISKAVLKKDYYYKSTKGSRLFDLKLNPINLAFIASTGAEDQKKCLTLSNLSTDDFIKEWLKYKNVELNEEMKSILGGAVNEEN